MSPRRGMRESLRGLYAVLRARLLAVGHAGRVERAAHDLVAHAREVLHAAASHEHDRVLLEVVALAGDVGGDLHTVREPYSRDLPKRRVRLLRGGRVDPGAHAPALRRGDPALPALARLEAGRRDLLLGARAALSDELGDAWHQCVASEVTPVAGRERRASKDAGSPFAG